MEPEPNRIEELRNPSWIEDPDLREGPRKHLPKREIKFWYEMIQKYLKPLDKDPEKEKQVTYIGIQISQLKNCTNKPSLHKDWSRSQGTAQSDGLLLPHDQRALGGDHLPIAREPGQGSKARNRPYNCEYAPKQPLFYYFRSTSNGLGEGRVPTSPTRRAWARSR